jgi:tetratricopeptide (TPR) repeat protein
MKRLAVPAFGAFLCALLCACASTPKQPSPAPYFNDALFAPPQEDVSANDVFALTDAMRQYLQVEIVREARNEGPMRGLISALSRHGELKLDYDADRTRNAAQAFDARKGNCLSLVIMTAAFAKALKLQVTYQSVDFEQTWSRHGNVAYQNAHVNLTLGRQSIDRTPGYDSARLLTVDFLPAVEILGQRTRPITEERIVAMYMNNRAAEALDEGRLDTAYWWARGAITRSPDFAAAYNTLGIVYLHHGDLDASAKVLAYLLYRDPDDTQVLSNYVVVLERLGRNNEAATLRARLSRAEPYPPYHFFFLGTAAMQRGDYLSARQLFTQEVNRAAYSGEFHFWLALAHFKLGDIDEARRQLTIAMANSTSASEHALYEGKLERLRSNDVR